MRVERLDTEVVEVPLPRPVGTAIHQMHSIGVVKVTIRTADLFGEGLAFSLNGDRIAAFDETIRGLARYVVGQSGFDVEKVFADIWGALNPTGHKGITIGALSAIDVALWDLIGKAADIPLAKLFGGMRDRVDAYASSGLFLSDPIDHLVTEAQRFVDEGFRAMKIRIGSPDPATDVERVRSVRETIGPDIALHSDVNQGLSPKAAIRLGRMLEPYDLAWIEEPVSYDDLAGHADVRSALDVPIASGETLVSLAVQRGNGTGGRPTRHPQSTRNRLHIRPLIWDHNGPLSNASGSLQLGLNEALRRSQSVPE